MYTLRLLSKFLLMVIVPIMLRAQTVDDILGQAYKDVQSYREQASPQDKENFVQYLQYYRAEGHYQAVQPAPRSLRESLSKAAKDLFRKLTEHAQKFTQMPQEIPGASRLTPDGEKFYESIKHMLKSSQ